MTGQPRGGDGAGCTESARYYKNIGQFFISPTAGDQIFFSQDGGKTCYHTGLVTKVSGSKVFTIEGNTSSIAGVVENGGAVREKSYSIGYNRISGYGRPKYELVLDEIPKKEEERLMTGPEILAALSDEEAYQLLQKAQRHTEKFPELFLLTPLGFWELMEKTEILTGGAPERLLKRDEMIAIMGRIGLL